MHVERTKYLDRLRSLEGTPDIKVITGIRRCGKSELMADFAHDVFKRNPSCNILYIDLLDLDNEGILEYHALHDYVTSSHVSDSKNYLFIDEIQLCRGFERAINSIHARGGWDVYLTGSNAFLLGSDLATLFTGRYREVHVFPFSLEEYMSSKGQSDPQDALESYVRCGGLAGSYAYPNIEESYGYIRDVYRTIITRDLAQKYNLPDTQALDRLAEYMLDNASNLTSPNKIADSLTSNGISANHVTVGRYISYLQDAFVFYPCTRYDIKGRKYLATQGKNYPADTGLRYAVLGTRNMDWGRMYETLVFLELKRRGYDVYVGKLYQKEIDFVAIRQSEKIYIQVSDNISDPTTFEREYSPLLKINDGYPKLIVARTMHPEYSYEGIRIFDIADWLAGEDD